MQRKRIRAMEYLSASGADPVEAIEAAAAASLDGVGLRLAAPLGLELGFPITGNPSRIRDIRRATERTGVRVLDTEVLTIAPHTKIADVLTVLEASAEIGAAFVQITSEDPEWSRAVQTFAGICDHADRLGLRMAFEFMQWRAVRTIEAAVRFLQAAGCPNGGIVLDTLHLSRSGGSPADVAKIPQELIHYVQLCDAGPDQPTTDEGLIAEARGGRLYPGEGTLWLDELFDILPVDIAVSIEVPGIAMADAPVSERVRRAARALDEWLLRDRAGRIPPSCGSNPVAS